MKEAETQLVSRSTTNVKLPGIDEARENRARALKILTQAEAEIEAERTRTRDNTQTNSQLWL